MASPLAVTFGGNGSAGTASRSDHSHTFAYQPGMAVGLGMVQTRAQGGYAAPNSGNGTIITPLNINITPKKAGNRIILEWVVNGDVHQDVVFVASRNGVLLPDSSNATNTRWAGIASGAYDQNYDSTPTNIVVKIIDTNSLSTASTYSLHVRSSSNAAYTLYLNRAQSSAGADAYEAGLSTGIATEFWW